MGDSQAIISATARTTEYATECMTNSTAHSSGGGLGKYSGVHGDVPLCISRHTVAANTETQDMLSRTSTENLQSHPTVYECVMNSRRDTEGQPFHIILKNARGLTSDDRLQATTDCKSCLKKLDYT